MLIAAESCDLVFEVIDTHGKFVTLELEWDSICERVHQRGGGKCGRGWVGKNSIKQSKNTKAHSALLCKSLPTSHLHSCDVYKAELCT